LIDIIVIIKKKKLALRGFELATETKKDKARALGCSATTLHAYGT